MTERIPNSPYWVENNSLRREGKESIDTLTNFNAVIVKELIYHDGLKTQTQLEISGELAFDADAEDAEKPPKLPNITIPASDFKGLGWVAEKWGMRPIIMPVSSAERDIAAAIQLQSKAPKHHIYTHTGWTQIDGKPTYLTGNGGITKRGLDTTITIQLPPELSSYKLPAPNDDPNALYQSLRLVNIGPRNVLWVMLLATYRAAIDAADFAIHLAGRTGTFKSEISSLFQSHYGADMDARHLPASWNSTANALEALAYRAKDAIMTVDDFVPVGTSWHVRALQAKADQFIRGQGNQAGRSRLTDVSALQQTMYPRGIILSTGEDIPDGHSVRGRMMIVELAPGEIDTAKMTIAQGNREQYAQAMANWIKWNAGDNAVAKRLPEARAKWRDQAQGIGHTRTASIVGDLIATAEFVAEWGLSMGWLDEGQAQDVQDKAIAAVMDSAEKQTEYLTTADPVNALCETIRQLLGSLTAHLKTRGGGVPDDPTKFGWTEVKAVGEIPTYKSNGPRIGWIDVGENAFYLDPNSLKLIGRNSGGKLAVTQQTLLKRCVEAGLITRTDSARQRNTVRVTVEGHSQQVLQMDLARVMDEDTDDVDKLR